MKSLSGIIGKALIMAAFDDQLALGVCDMKGNVTRSELTHNEAVKDGQIMDSDAVLQSIECMNRGARYKKAAVIINSSFVIIRFGIYPELKGKELENAVNGSYDQYFPPLKEKMVVSWKPVRHYDNKVEIILAAVPLVISESYVSLLKKMNIGISFIDVYDSFILEWALDKQQASVNTDKQEDTIIVYRKQNRLAFLYLPNGIGAIGWDVPDGDDGLIEMNRCYAYYVMDGNRGGVTIAHMLCICPEWLRSFFKDEGIKLIDRCGYNDYEHDYCFQKAAKRLRRRSPV